MYRDDYPIVLIISISEQTKHRYLLLGVVEGRYFKHYTCHPPYLPYSPTPGLGLLQNPVPTCCCNEQSDSSNVRLIFLLSKTNIFSYFPPLAVELLGVPSQIAVRQTYKPVKETCPDHVRIPIFSYCLRVSSKLRTYFSDGRVTMPSPLLACLSNITSFSYI